MYEFYPLLIVGAIISVFATAFILAYAFMKDKKEAIGFDRNMKDSEIIRRLLVYAKPYTKSFVVVLILMIFSIAHEIISPLILGDLIKTVGSDEGFELSDSRFALLCDNATQGIKKQKKKRNTTSADLISPLKNSTSRSEHSTT